jgi:hypothetical protein
MRTGNKYAVKGKFHLTAHPGDHQEFFKVAADNSASMSLSPNQSRCSLLPPYARNLNTKEELLYYRLFREHFGEAGDLAWMGRTKGIQTR